MRPWPYRDLGAFSVKGIAGPVSGWQAEDHRMDVAAWLEGLSLERYAPAFRDNEIDWDALPKLTAEERQPYIA
jgi:SAM domain (Sterile alpha motif)